MELSTDSMEKVADKEHWSELGFKDKTAYTTAIASFVLGWIIVLIGIFIDPQGKVDHTIITCFGIALSYTGAVLGIFLYVKDKNLELYNDVMARMNRMERRHEYGEDR